MGLLDQNDSGQTPILSRAIRMRGHAPAPTEPPPILPPDETEELPVDPGAAARALLRELSGGRHSGIATPSHLFSVLHRHLQVRRGALLVPIAEDGIFVPAAIAGLDRTSRLRLRIDEAELESLVAIDRVTVLAGDRRNAFEPYLSRGDAEIARRIALFPFFHLKRLLAVLVIFDSTLLDLDGATMDTLLGALADAAGQMLFNGRTRLIGSPTGRVVFGRDHLATALERVGRKAEPDGVSVITIDLGPLTERILAEHRHLDLARLQRDLVESCALLTQREFDVVELGGMRLAFVGSRSDLLDAELFVHLLSTTLGELFCVPIHHPLDFETPSVDDLTSEG